MRPDTFSKSWLCLVFLNCFGGSRAVIALHDSTDLLNRFVSGPGVKRAEHSSVYSVLWSMEHKGPRVPMLKIPSQNPARVVGGSRAVIALHDSTDLLNRFVSGPGVKRAEHIFVKGGMPQPWFTVGEESMHFCEGNAFLSYESSLSI